MPYIYDLTYDTGTVDGLYIGLYALTEPRDARQHEIQWSATGQGTRYKSEGIAEGWTSPVDYNEPTFLVDNVPEDR